MNGFDEQLIEKYIRRPDALNPSEREAAEALLARSLAARAVAEVFRAFYDEFAALAEDTSPAVEAFLDGLFPPARVISLHPYRTSDGPTVLAAQTPSQPLRFETLATLASEEKGILVRLLWDRARRRGQLYTMAAEPEHRAHALIVFADLGFYVVTDADGRATLDLSDEHVEAVPASRRTTLHLPLAACSMTANHLETDTLLCTFDGTALHLTVPPDQHDPAPTYAVLETPEKTTLIALQDGSGQVTLDALPERFILRLYP